MKDETTALIEKVVETTLVLTREQLIENDEPKMTKRETMLLAAAISASVKTAAIMTDAAQDSILNVLHPACFKLDGGKPNEQNR